MEPAMLESLSNGMLLTSQDKAVSLNFIPTGFALPNQKKFSIEDKEIEGLLTNKRSNFRTASGKADACIDADCVIIAAPID
jgi:hypothetical protein